MERDTICALATPPGVGGVGIVRLSGPRADEALRALCPRLPKALESHKLYLTRLYEPRSGAFLDEVLAVLMRGPRSYTGEDVAELHGHGGPLNMARLLEAAQAVGCRVAQPGEFTQRAFVSGRLDLTQAEAVADLIHASSEAALAVARQHLAGGLGEEIRALQRAVVEAVVLTEAAIDFSTEEHVYQLDLEGLGRRLAEVIARMERLLGSWEAGRQMREGVRVVILGRPNAGKSTLFNKLCGEPRAIVTEIPGTTRDFLEERVVVEGVALCLVDTAGLREAQDPVERIGVERSRQQAARADVLVWLVDGSVPWSVAQEEREALAAPGVDVLPVLNKADAGLALSEADLAALEALGGRAPLRVSLLGEARPDALMEALAALARARLATGGGEGAVLTRARHRAAVSKAQASLTRAWESAQRGLGHELVALDLREALDALGEVLGKTRADDILARIFAEFCVGK